MDHFSSSRGNFDTLMGSVGTRIVIFFFVSIGGFSVAMHTYAYEFWGPMLHDSCYTRDPASNWTSPQIYYPAIPGTMEDAKRLYHSCQVYSVNYSQIEDLNILSHIEDIEHINQRCFFISSKNTENSQERTFLCEGDPIYFPIPVIIHCVMIIGFIMIGTLIDRFGRRYIYSRCVVLYLICEICTLLSPNAIFFVCIRTLASLFGAGLFIAGFLLIIEFSSQAHRSLVGICFVLPWSVGVMVISGISFEPHPWWKIQVILCLPVMLMIPNLWTVPESPRWSILHERYDEAYETFESVALSNNILIPDKESLIEDMRQIHLQIKLSTDASQPSLSRKKNIYNFLFSKKETLYLLVGSFFTSLAYAEIFTASPEMKLDNHWSSFLMGVLEILAYGSLWFGGSYIGRKKYALGLYSCTIIVVVVSYIINRIVENHGLVILKTSFYMVAKLSILSLPYLLWIQAAETHSTINRASVLGMLVAVSRLASIIQPCIHRLDNLFPYGHLMTIGTSVLISATMLSHVPETTNSPLE